MNIAEILKDAPRGIKLYSPVYGEVTFSRIDNDVYSIVVNDENNNVTSFTADGRFYPGYPNAECLLFPSKDNRDWSTFKVEPQFPTDYTDSLDILGWAGKSDYLFDELESLQILLAIRDAWWKVDNDWKPDWSNAAEVKSTITLFSNRICACESYRTHCILAFRTPEIRNKFLETFRELIEQCKELI